jgi:hypothetical protein
MIDIPIGKAIVPVEVEDPYIEGPECRIGCFLNTLYYGNFACAADGRKDGKNMIFKLVDYPAKKDK